MKKLKSGLSLVIAVVMCLSLLPMTTLAADTPSSWAEADVNKAIAANLVPQALQSQYTQVITRAEFTALAVAMYEAVTGKEITERTKFNDTTDINVEKAAAIGVVSGVGNNNFSPNTGLTREQAATMLSRLADSVGKPLTKQAATFADNGSISSWALEAVGQIQAAGVMSGVGNNTFAPKNDYTREQSIMTVLRLYDVVGGGNTTATTEVTGIAILSRHRDYDDNAREISIAGYVVSGIAVAPSAYFDIVVYPVEIAEKHPVTITLSNENIGNISKVTPMRKEAIDSIKFEGVAQGQVIVTVSCEGFSDSFVINVSGIATAPPTKPDTNHPLYEDFPVPDFGAIYGVSPLTTSSVISSVMTYYYDMSEVDESAGNNILTYAIQHYEEILVECGFTKEVKTSLDGELRTYWHGYGYSVRVDAVSGVNGHRYSVQIQKL